MSTMFFSAPASSFLFFMDQRLLSEMDCSTPIQDLFSVPFLSSLFLPYQFLAPDSLLPSSIDFIIGRIDRVLQVVSFLMGLYIILGQPGHF